MSDILSDAYSGDGGAGTTAFYNDWSARYEAETRAMGYVLPEIAAGWTARYASGEGPLLEGGCGTGLVGANLALLNITGVIGLDASGAMVEVARQTGVYSRLVTHSLGQPLPFEANHFAACLCYGSFGPGHAPIRTLRDFVDVTKPGGRILFNLREDTYAEQGFEAEMMAMTEENLWRPMAQSPAFRAFVIAEPDLLVRLFAFEVV